MLIFLFFNFFKIEKSIYQLKNRFRGHFFVKFHKILSLGYRKIDLRCLIWSRMIPEQKSNSQKKIIFLNLEHVFSIKKTFEVKKKIVKIHKFLSFGYRKIDVR